RQYQYLVSTNDDGWLCGGGESGESYKLPSPDSAHIEIMRMGTFDPDLGGLNPLLVMEAVRAGRLLIPHMEIMPTGVVENGDAPPELEVRFDLMGVGDRGVVGGVGGLGFNWQLEFVRRQLYVLFQFPARFTPGAFHMTLARKAAYRSSTHRTSYLRLCNKVVQLWKQGGARGLSGGEKKGIGGKEVYPLSSASSHPHGMYIFRHRNLPLFYLPPNIHPPYTEEMGVIMGVMGMGE
ncbi:hypothetical protein B484DRAFT_335325, partial [Ochromonadaceae sp. CCMP2298]